jgi:hypothetical protein
MNVSTEMLLAAIQEEFEEIINKKTGWGKNDILFAFERAKVNALARFL